MEVIPAIDLRGGKCVRLYQGDYDRETVYSEDPIEVAARWVCMGATRIHIVDLDGAKDGAPANIEVIEGIASSVSVPVQLGGGIRSVEDARMALSLGVDRVMVGTAAIENPDLIQNMREALGAEAVVVSVDARDGYVAVKGWTQSSRTLASDLIQHMTEMGVLRFLYTDIARDGTLSEPNFPSIEALASQTKAHLMAAGGISSIDHLVRLDALGVEAAIVGKALYTEDIHLEKALETLNKHTC
jgi:phosphoribosylformimino-5-aminoimidazole carboxamide ribotide isomerase